MALSRCLVTQSGVRSDLVVVASPSFDDHASLAQAAEPFDVQAFVAEPAVEALVGAVLPRLSRLDQCRADLRCLDPFKDPVADELWPVVRPQLEPPRVLRRRDRFSQARSV